LDGSANAACSKVNIHPPLKMADFFIHRVLCLQIYYYVIIKIMKNKWIFIGIGILLIMVVGVIIFLHFTSPEVLTKTPLELITGRVIQNEEKDVISTPTELVGITDNFIVPDEVWENAFLLNRVDGTPYKGFIGFSDIPIGTKLYAPMDGYIHYLRTLNERNEVVDSVAILTQSATYPSDADSRKIYFLAREIKIINTEPKKGEVFATILDNKEMSPDQYGWYNRKTLLAVSVDDTWSELSDRNIEDPKDYLNTIIKLKR